MASEIKTVDDLRGAYPALVKEAEETAANKATNEERARIRDIEEMALRGSEKETYEAKFTKPMSASDYAAAAMKRFKAAMEDDRAQGRKWMKDMAKDTKQLDRVTPEPPKDEQHDEFMDAIKSVNKKQ